MTSSLRHNDAITQNFGFLRCFANQRPSKVKKFRDASDLKLLFNLKPKEMAKMRLLAIWIDHR